MSTEAIRKFARRLVTVFGEPKTADLDAYLAELATILGRFSDEELQEGATLLMQQSKYRTWPLPGEMLSAAEAARKQLLAARQPQDTGPDNPDPYSNQSKAAAYRLIQSETGRQAADNGWIGHLFSFCCHHRRMPTNVERQQLVEKARLFDELYAKTTRDLGAMAGKPVERQPKTGTWQPVGGGNAHLLRTAITGMDYFLSERNRLAAIAHGQQQEAAQ